MFLTGCNFTIGEIHVHARLFKVIACKLCNYILSNINYMFYGCLRVSENATAVVSGHVHYVSFDRQLINYNGIGRILLVKTDSGATSQLHIYAETKSYYGHGVAYLTCIEIWFITHGNAVRFCISGS